MQLQQPSADLDASRVLIVDDDVDLAESTSALFRQMGHVTEVAVSGKAALAQYPAFSPDLVLLDLDMPGMHGLEVAEAVRSSEHGSQVFLAAHTAAEKQSAQIACANAGFDYFLAKPVDVETFDRLIRSIRKKLELTRFETLVTQYKATTYALTLEQLQFCSLVIDSLAISRSNRQQRIVRLDRVLGLVERWLAKDASIALDQKQRIALEVFELRARLDPFRIS